MGERFHLPSAPAAGGRAWLEDDEGRHLARVLRARPGDVVRVFDGAGREASARVVEVERGRVLLEVLAAVQFDDQLCLRGAKINDEITNRMLAAKMDIFQLVRAKGKP